MPKQTTPPTWRKATEQETADFLAGNWYWEVEVRETTEGLEILEGESLDCGCIPHYTHMRGMWGFYCETEDQGYCNFECPHYDENED